jgi:hypothetical protein
VKYDKSKCTSLLGFKGYSGCMCSYCQKYANSLSPWTVNLLGKLGDAFELSIVRKTNRHGIASYGWFDDRKLLVSHSFHQFTVNNKKIWDGLIKLAAKVCDDMNKEDKKG